MQTQQSEQAGSRAAEIAAAPPPYQQEALYTVKQYATINSAFTEPALRNLIHKATPRHSSRGEIAGNGLVEAGAILRIGRKVLIDHVRFVAWIRAQNGWRK